MCAHRRNRSVERLVMLGGLKNWFSFFVFFFLRHSLIAIATVAGSRDSGNYWTQYIYFWNEFHAPLTLADHQLTIIRMYSYANGIVYCNHHKVTTNGCNSPKRKRIQFRCVGIASNYLRLDTLIRIIIVIISRRCIDTLIKARWNGDGYTPPSATERVWGERVSG